MLWLRGLSIMKMGNVTKPLRIKVLFSRKELQSLIFGAFSFLKIKTCILNIYMYNYVVLFESVEDGKGLCYRTQKLRRFY